jgi:hypothetical protein
MRSVRHLRMTVDADGRNSPKSDPALKHHPHRLIVLEPSAVDAMEWRGISFAPTLLLQSGSVIHISGGPTNNESRPMNNSCGAHATPRTYAAALDQAASEEDHLAEELALLAAALDGHGCPCAAEAFWRSARRRRVQGLLQTAQALAARVI